MAKSIIHTNTHTQVHCMYAYKKPMTMAPTTVCTNTVVKITANVEVDCIRLKYEI